MDIVVARNSVEYRLVSVATRGEGGSPYRAVMIGEGAYARVYRGIQIVSTGRNSSEKRPVAVKVFNEGAQEDYNLVFEAEKKALINLGAHDNVASLLAFDERLPPTFVCQTCGEVFQVVECPKCSSALSTDDEHQALVCSGIERHGFQLNRREAIESLLAKRPCRCKGECDTITFFHRPCLVFDALDLNFREFNRLLLDSDENVSERGARILAPTEMRPCDWSRERFLMRLEALVGIAEGLAFLHASKVLHGDINPENAMVSVSGVSPGSTNPPSLRRAKLIDLGLAQATESRQTRIRAGQAPFESPEAKTKECSMSGGATFSPSEGDFRTGGMCALTMAVSRRLGFHLEPGDLVRDNRKGEYLVKGRLAAESDGKFELEIRTPPRNTHSEFTVPAFFLKPVPQFPSDIYSLGLLVAWFVTGGQDDLLEELESHARRALIDDLPVDEALPHKLLGDKYVELRKSVKLWDDFKQDARTGPRPNGQSKRIAPQVQAAEDGICDRLLLVIFKCLVRKEGAYAKSRGSTSDRAARLVAEDLRGIRDELYFIHRTRHKVLGWMSDWMKGSKTMYDQLADEHIQLSKAFEEAKCKFEKQSADLKELVAEQKQDVSKVNQVLQRTAHRNRLARRTAGPILLCLCIGAFFGIRGATRAGLFDKQVVEIWERGSDSASRLRSAENGLHEVTQGLESLKSRVGSIVVRVPIGRDATGAQVCHEKHVACSTVEADLGAAHFVFDCNTPCKRFLGDYQVSEYRMGPGKTYSKGKMVTDSFAVCGGGKGDGPFAVCIGVPESGSSFVPPK